MLELILEGMPLELVISAIDLLVHPVNKGKIGIKRKMSDAPPTTGARIE
jgi:hypothetical protein